jgi:hypothetical protein
MYGPALGMKPLQNIVVSIGFTADPAPYGYTLVLDDEHRLHEVFIAPTDNRTVWN